MAIMTLADQPQALGMGFSIGKQGEVIVGEINDLNAEQSVVATRSLGGVNVVLRGGATEAGNRTFLAEVDQVARGEQVALLMFVPGTAIETLEVRVQSDVGQVSVQQMAGSGAKTLTIDTTDEGFGASVPLAAGGTISRSSRFAQGIAGAFADCGGCLAQASMGDVRGGRQDVGPVKNGSSSFAGPAGTWQFEWTGVKHSYGARPVLAAYAPVGEHWARFVRRAERP
jgi:hypothetical protein